MPQGYSIAERYNEKLFKLSRSQSFLLFLQKAEFVSGSAAQDAICDLLRPDPIPVIILARLGVDQRYQGMGLGRSLMKHAYSAALLVSESIGAVCLIVHATDDDVADFYQALSFDPFPRNNLTLFRKFH